MRRLLAAVVLTGVLAALAHPQVSLWKPKKKSVETAPATVAESPLNVVRDVKARDFKVHDIVSVIVSLSAEASTDEKADSETKMSKANLLINQYLKLQREGLQVHLKGEKPEDLGLDLSADKKLEGKGASDRTDTLRTRLAAEIVDIKPNGNLVIEAKHSFTKQREKTTITLSGVVRPQDVAPDNTVYSYNVADADIRYESAGPITDANRRGWLAKFMDKIWPF